MDKYSIAVLAEDYPAKLARRELLAQRNVAHLTPDERLAALIEYEIADAECFRAYVAMHDAKFSITPPTEDR